MSKKGRDIDGNVIMGGDDALYVYGGESASGGWQTAQLSHWQGYRMAELAAVMRRGLKLEPQTGLSAIPTKTFGDGISSLRCRGAS